MKGETENIPQSNLQILYKKLQRNEERYRCIVEAVTDYIYTVKIEDGCPVETKHNPTCVAVTGYTSDEFNANPFLWIHIVHEEDRDAVIKQAERVTKGEPAKPLEHRIIHKNGLIRWVKNTSVVCYDEQGRLVSYDGVISDITERRQAENKLIESEEHLITLINALPDVIFLKDGKGRWLVTNAAAQKLFQLDNIDWQGKTELELAEIQPHLHLQQAHITCKDSDDAAWAHGKRFDRIEIIEDDKELIHFFEVTKIPLFTPSGKRKGIVIIGRDITERKNLEKQLLQAQKMEAIGQLTGGIAHDFNNILTAIMGYGSLMRSQIKEDNLMKTYLEQILSSAEKAANLTQSLLAFSRKQIINPAPINLNDIVRKVEKLLKRLIGEDIELKVILSDMDLNIMADSVQIEQVLMNLATNARDAMPNGGVFTIETKPVSIDEEYTKRHAYMPPGVYALLSVTDAGIGMDEKTKERLFEPFFTTKEVGKGTGLGLSIVYGIIKQHNAFINAYSEIDKGTIFKIYLPMIKSEIEIKQAKVLPPLKGGTETILLAEDDINVRTLIKSVLQDYGYKVIESVDGEDALERFLENKENIHFVLLDVVMPKKDGKKVYEAIKAIKPNIKALFISGYAADIIHKKGILEVDIDFVQKPISPNDLLRKVREILDRSSHKPSVPQY